ncbi:MAG: hypothetical protein PVF44_14175, partial [Syntrophobacterales bacterium]
LTVDTYERGFGLGSMRERTELSGGTFVIDSGKGKGTIVRASWPYDEALGNSGRWNNGMMGWKPL